MKHKIIIGLDPSSTVIGYAAKKGNVLLQGGVIYPDRKSAGSFERICSMRKDLVVVLNHFEPDIILLEWTKGKVNINRHHGMGAGLAVYGCGVGAAAVEVEHWTNGRQAAFYVINENEWTRGIKKAQRQLAVASMYNEYKISEDPGGDISDAIGIIDWWTKENLY